MNSEQRLSFSQNIADFAIKSRLPSLSSFQSQPSDQNLIFKKSFGTVLFITADSLDQDSESHSLTKLFNKKVVIDQASTGGSWNLKRAVSICSESNSPQKSCENFQIFARDMNKALFFNDSNLYQQQSIDNINSFELNETPVRRLESFDKDAVEYIGPYTASHEIKQAQLKPQNPLLLVDCRYEYEYAAGHIQGAYNWNNPLQIKELFFESLDIMEKNPIVILYCEFSEKRSVKMYKLMKRLDREVSDYPKLKYPDLYILHQGFSNFYKEHQESCSGTYLQMLDPSCIDQYKAQRRENEGFWDQLKPNFRKRSTIK